MEPWNGWYHVNWNTFGTWLPGDPRGWREKKHKRHVPGDYRNPPPKGYGEGLHNYARRQMSQSSVRLNRSQRATIGKALVEKLIQQEIEVLAISVDGIHCHLLGRFTDKQVRPRVGKAKKHATFTLRRQGSQIRLWERSSHPKPITSRDHQVCVYRYILNHGNKGAWTWSYREGLYWL